jgi:hypothetical protein
MIITNFTTSLLDETISLRIPWDEPNIRDKISHNSS